MANQKYIVTKLFKEGPLKDMRIAEHTEVLFTEGQTYRCAATGDIYEVVAVTFYYGEAKGIKVALV